MLPLGRPSKVSTILGTRPSARPGCGCIGTLLTPNGIVTGDSGDIYYSRRNLTCYINNAAPGASGTGWVTANTASQAQRQVMGSSQPGLPPFAMIDQEKSQHICSGLTVAGIAGTKRLLRRKEHFAVAAWDASLSDATITTMEIGTSLDSTFHCNSSYASPQGNSTTDLSISNPSIAFDNSEYPGAVNRDTLPACRFGDCISTTSVHRSLRTGSNSTRLCVSRYGAQDVIGNVVEWTSDQITCNGTTCAGLASGANPIDPANDDFSGVSFDNVQGPTTTNTVTTWGILQIPIGVPIVDPGFSGDGKVSLTAAQLHGDNFWITVAASLRGAINGGSWGTGSLSGRHALHLSRAPTYTDSPIGIRCGIPAE